MVSFSASSVLVSSTAGGSLIGALERYQSYKMHNIIKKT